MSKWFINLKKRGLGGGGSYKGFFIGGGGGEGLGGKRLQFKIVVGH